MTLVDFTLNDQVAIVTGTAPGGIGEAYARALAEAGASVVCADLDGAAAEEVAASVRTAGGSAVGVGVDIADDASVREMVSGAVVSFGAVDILVNNAAAMEEILGPSLMEFPPSLWQKAFDVNVTGTWNCCRAVVPEMIKRGGGRIVNQSSISAYQAHGVYGITKLAIIGLTTSLARELGPSGITVNSIAPGVTLSAKISSRLKQRRSTYMDQLEQQAALRPLGAPTDLCGALVLLASSAGSWITGQVMVVDGGVVLSH